MPFHSRQNLACFNLHHEDNHLASPRTLFPPVILSIHITPSAQALVTTRAAMKVEIGVKKCYAKPLLKLSREKGNYEES